MMIRQMYLVLIVAIVRRGHGFVTNYGSHHIASRPYGHLVYSPAPYGHYNAGQVSLASSGAQSYTIMPIASVASFAKTSPVTSLVPSPHAAPSHYPTYSPVQSHYSLSQNPSYQSFAPIVPFMAYSKYGHFSQAPFIATPMNAYGSPTLAASLPVPSVLPSQFSIYSMPHPSVPSALHLPQLSQLLHSALAQQQAVAQLQMQPQAPVPMQIQISSPTAEQIQATENLQMPTQISMQAPFFQAQPAQMSSSSSTHLQHHAAKESRPVRQSRHSYTANSEISSWKPIIKTFPLKGYTSEHSATMSTAHQQTPVLSHEPLRHLHQLPFDSDSIMAMRHSNLLPLYIDKKKKK